MEVHEAILARKSIRGYKPDPVPKEIIEKILETAVRAPSALNTQPWEFAVATGGKLEAIRRENVERLYSGASIDADVHKGVYKERQRKVGYALYSLLGIARDDVTKRKEWEARGFKFFGAPAVIYIIVDDLIKNTRFASFDAGAVCQTICLAALEYGLGTCIEAQAVFFPDIAKKHLALPESKELVMGIAIGYPDWSFPANELRSQREPVENITKWYGFD